MRSKGEDFAVNDICWCPGNSTVFAAVTVDAKLQVWDLSVSNLDPIFSYDTSVDDVTLPKPAIIPEEAERIGTAASAPSTAANVNAPPPAPAHRYGRMQKEEDKEPLMMKLLKNLSHKEPTSKRVLTTVLFGARSPTVVVGDDKGAVTVYRIVDPVTITHEGPKQQADKLNAAVALLASDEGRQPGQEQT
jgi:WD40 repeat protein